MIHFRENTSDTKAIEEVLVKKGYERKDFRISSGESWLDMGGHIGTFSIFAAEKGARVKAFEPDREHFSYLEKNTEGYRSLVEINNFGLSNENKEANYYRNSKKGNTWRNSFLKKWRGGETIRCQLRNYRDFISDDICVKMDIEGSELIILQDMLETGLIKKVKKMVVEWSFDINKEVPVFLDIVKRLDFYMKRLTPTDHYLNRLQPHKEYPKSWFPPAAKLFFIRKGNNMTPRDN